MDIPFTTKARPDTGLYNAKLGIWLFLASEVMLFGAFFSAYILLRVGADPGAWAHGLMNVPIGTFNTFVLILSSVTVVMAWAALKAHNYSLYRNCMVITIACALGFLVVKSFEYAEKFRHYEVWMKDGTRMTGHIDYQDGAVKKHAYLWNTKTLSKKKIESIAFTPDAPNEWMPGQYYPPMTKEQLEHVKKHDGKGAHHHEAVTIKSADIQRLSAFVPAHSTFFAIYFTMTALHGLHVLGGAIVLSYFLFRGRKMWQADPDRLTNRVEVGGLFWHFVDLVWIFLFPIMYIL